jgi:hypothetical protein
MSAEIKAISVENGVQSYVPLPASGVGIPGEGAFSDVFNEPLLASRATGEASHAEGKETTATGLGAHAEGTNSTAQEQGAHAEGNSSAFGRLSHSEGNSSAGFDGNVFPQAYCAHAEGLATSATGKASHSQNASTTAAGDYSHAGGNGNAAHYAQTVIGEFAIDDGGPDTYRDPGQALLKVGNGTDGATRSDAFAVYEDGTGYISKRILKGIWDGYAEGPFQFSASPGAGLLGNGAVLKGSTTIPNSADNFALGDRFVFEWDGIIASTGTAANLFTNPFGTTLDAFESGPTGTYLAKVVTRALVVGFSGSDPIIQQEFSVKTWVEGAACYTTQEDRQAHFTGGTFPSNSTRQITLSAPFVITMGLSATAATKPKQLGFRAWRE